MVKMKKVRLDLFKLHNENDKGQEKLKKLTKIFSEVEHAQKWIKLESACLANKFEN